MDLFLLISPIWSGDVDFREKTLRSSKLFLDKESAVLSTLLILLRSKNFQVFISFFCFFYRQVFQWTCRMQCEDPWQFFFRHLWWVCVCQSIFLWLTNKSPPSAVKLRRVSTVLFKSLCEFILFEAVVWRRSLFLEKPSNQDPTQHYHLHDLTTH